MTRRKTSAIEDMLQVVSLLPWWAGLTLAVLSYFILHSLATPSTVPVTRTDQLTGVALRTVVTTVAALGQYVLPVIFLVAAGMSFWNRRERHALVASVAATNATAALDGLSWHEFELLVGEGFRLNGYRVSETGGAAADGGLDLVLTKQNERFFVQCKQWKAYKVGVGVVRELYGVMAARGAAGGFVVTSGRFTEEAKAFARGRNVTLIAGDELLALLEQAKDSAGAREGRRATPDMSARTPPCPVCGSEMVKRTARKGANAGAQFWGCAKYPACRGTRPASDAG